MILIVSVYCYTHAFRTYLRQQPLMYLSNAGPFGESIYLLASFWNNHMTSQVKRKLSLSKCRINGPVLPAKYYLLVSLRNNLACRKQGLAPKHNFQGVVTGLIEILQQM